MVSVECAVCVCVCVYALVQMSGRKGTGERPPENGEIALWSNTRVANCKYHVLQKQIGSMIRASGTVFYSLLYFNSRLGFNGLKY